MLRSSMNWTCGPQRRRRCRGVQQENVPGISCGQQDQHQGHDRYVMHSGENGGGGGVRSRVQAGAAQVLAADVVSSPDTRLSRWKMGRSFLLFFGKVSVFFRAPERDVRQRLLTEFDLLIIFRIGKRGRIPFLLREESLLRLRCLPIVLQQFSKLLSRLKTLTAENFGKIGSTAKPLVFQGMASRFAAVSSVLISSVAASGCFRKIKRLISASSSSWAE